MGFRRRSREIALQVLFQTEYSQQLSSEQALSLYLDNFEVEPEVREFAVELTLGVLDHKKELDQLISANSQNWKVTRMAFVDKNILRLAVFEMKYLSTRVPFKVAIDEAIEIAKRFGSQDSSSFVNGVLDNVAKSLNA